MTQKLIHKIIRDCEISRIRRGHADDPLLGKRVLDVGCGAGNEVNQLVDACVDAYGVDIKFKNGVYTEALISTGRLKTMSGDTYAIPFDSGTFDVVYADQVVEHVEDLDVFVREVARVLRPGGTFIAYFPSRWKAIEPHVGVPFGGVIQKEWWIRAAVRFGLYYRKKTSLPRKEASEKILRYLREKTFYRRRRTVQDTFSRYFSSVQFREEILLRNMCRRQAGVIRKIPLGAKMFGLLWSSLLVANTARESAAASKISEGERHAKTNRRVTLLINSLGGGGAERVCVTLANGLAEHGFNVDLVVLWLDDAVFADVVDKRVRIIDLGSRRARSSALALSRYIRSMRPDVIVVFNRQLLVILAVLRRFVRVPFALVSRNINLLSQVARWQRSIWHGVIVERLVKWTYRNADRVVAQTEDMAEDLVAHYGLDRTLIDVIYNPASPEIAAAADASPVRNSLLGDERYFLFIGKLERQKGLPFLIDAFARFHRRCPDVKLVMLGRGSLEKDLLKEVQAVGLEKAIRFEGFQADVVPWYQNALATVLTSHYEGMPNVLVESITLGTPVVAFDCPSGPAAIVVEGENGYLVPYADVAAFAERLELVASHAPFDPARVRATAERFRADAIVQRYMKVIEETARQSS